MCKWNQAIKRNYEEAARKLVAGGYQRRKLRGQTVEDIFVKDGYAFYLGRKLGSTKFQTYPVSR